MLWREAFTQARVTRQMRSVFVFVFLCLQMGRRNDMFRLVVVEGICCDVHVSHQFDAAYPTVASCSCKNTTE